MTNDTRGLAQSSRAMTPLWVISLFVSLTEVVTGIAVKQASGGIQVALTSFVIAFPLLVAAAFFAILWARPYVFYAPTEFGAETDVTKFVDAMRRRDELDTKTITLIRTAVDGALASPQVIARVEQTLKSEDDVSQKIEAILKDASREAWSSVEKNSLTIDPTQIVGADAEVRQVPYDPDQLVFSFLDDVWFSLAFKVPGYRFGELWFLRDANSGFELRDAGRTWAKKRGELEDLRTLSQVGIRAGMHLAAIPIKK